MQSVARLRVFNEAEELAVRVYQLTRTLPAEERFGLGLQMRRAALSIGSNIAEGCGRDTAPDLARFLSIALGSATELEFQSRVALRMGYLNASQHSSLAQSVIHIQKMLIRLILRVRPVSKASRGRP
jgi:four helix bundle protein